MFLITERAAVVDHGMKLIKEEKLPKLNRDSQGILIQAHVWMLCCPIAYCNSINVVG
ncbi:hypothetical protein T4E_11880 [Trichinella pseudospiralis]|uniref:Uncharacterized protein n=1 Tax=Trichinella pseudospiralis TaxID=6337 RepID=A0A0V1FJ20_TRIPS|nr:hypothetical protein T4E_11880 [Trichinella pseudospiralis]KRY85711.1 hypothetical protein T4D_1808 [Trichinella pseudospiralis]